MSAPTTSVAAGPISAEGPLSPSAESTPADPDLLHDLTEPQRHRLRWGRPLNILGPVGVILAVLGIWELATTSGLVQDFVLPSPSAIAAAVQDDPELFWSNTAATTVEALIALVLGTLAAVITSVVFVYSPFVQRSAYPLALAAQSIPVIAIAPLLAIWLGPGLVSKVIVAGFLCYFPTLVSMQRGLRAVDPETMELMASYNAGWWRVLIKVRLRTALPYLFVAMKIGAGGCFVGALTAEWIGADKGLGYLISILGSQFRIPELWGAAMIASMLAVTAFVVVSIVEYLAMPWRRGRVTDNA
ncbi:ABC transporter permease [Nocardia sp. NPDC024068]|uniref:ABC transporter permease n=1 Tax=Nocardia sp. NPDC024068 TaxID=3157197 RepID=UPI0033EE604C